MKGRIFKTQKKIMANFSQKAEKHRVEKVHRWAEWTLIHARSLRSTQPIGGLFHLHYILALILR